jgi:hypothetical protein
LELILCQIAALSHDFPEEAMVPPREVFISLDIKAFQELIQGRVALFNDDQTEERRFQPEGSVLFLHLFEEAGILLRAYKLPKKHDFR